jgi:hypothetical protein
MWLIFFDRRCNRQFPFSFVADALAHVVIPLTGNSIRLLGQGSQSCVSASFSFLAVARVSSGAELSADGADQFFDYRLLLVILRLSRNQSEN